MKYREITCASACNRVKGRFPHSWDLNLYRGCEHGCRYCFALYTHQYLESERFYDEIFVKTNIVQQLERQLSSRSWKQELISIGGVTDSYQPAERQYQLMPEVLKLMIRYRTPCIISTKSDLILRDYDLIAELARHTYVNVACTITCVSEELARSLEPGGAPPKRRFEVLRAFSDTNASTGLHVMPVIPYLTDSEENLSGLYAAAKQARVSYVLPGSLYLRGRTRETFFRYIRQSFPRLEQPLRELYRGGQPFREYKRQLYQMENRIRAQYGLTANYNKIMKEKLARSEHAQLDFFDLI